MDAHLQMLKTEYAKYFQLLKDEHYLDDQFLELVQLVDDSTPNFVVEVVTLFSNESLWIFNGLGHAMRQNPTDYCFIAAHVFQLKERSIYIGAQRVKNVCLDFDHYCPERNYEGCLTIFQRLVQEVASLRRKLHLLFEMERNFLAAGGILADLHRSLFT